MPVQLNKEANLIIQVRLIKKGNDEPLGGKKIKVRLYDKDIFNDDFLGESEVHDGLASFNIQSSTFKKPLGLDDRPDFYFAVYRNDEEIFRSRVMSNLDLSDIEEFVMKEGNIIDLGTFLI